MINKNKKLFLKFILASFLISALAVTLGFFGTHLILSSQEKRIENHFIPEALRTIEFIHEKTNMPIAEIVSEYNDISKYTRVGEDTRRGSRRPPMTISVITRETAVGALPEQVGTFLEINNKFSDFKMFKDQIYNYDDMNFLVFKFNPLGPPPLFKSGGPKR
ncbi:MAG: hypothetical protein K2Q18_05790, partial [Bdellovibrionales bacterium]|nr:hypothetical protein [Bdellovibrionales bacterium]